MWIFFVLQRDDFAAISATLRQYLPEKDTPYVLDVDLDFFSTKNPFITLYERANVYEKLAELYSFKRPDTVDPVVSEKEYFIFIQNLIGDYPFKGVLNRIENPMGATEAAP